MAEHRWKFFRAGGFDQVRLDSGDDLLNLEGLDQKLWLALSCPVQGIEFDAGTLAYLDADGDGQVRAPELLAAIRWAGGLLNDRDLLTNGAAELPLAAIDETSEEGRQLLASARHILAALGKPGASAISTADSGDKARIFADARFNGDGIVSAEAAEDEGLSGLIADIVSAYGGEPDVCGRPGVSQALADRFFEEAQAWLDWQAQPEQDAAILPLGEGTEAAFAALEKLRGKGDDYFARCRLAAFDPRAGQAMNGSEADLAALAGHDLATELDQAAALPLAFVAAGKALPLGEEVNPAWASAVQTFAGQAVVPLLGEREALTEAEWLEIKARFAPFSAWRESAVDTPAAGLGRERLEQCLQGDGRERLNALITQDAALKPELDAITGVDKLVHYVRDLGAFANNFVAFRDFYTRRDKAVFQAGTLYLDGRSCELCVRIDNEARHATLATLSRMCLVYCECVRGGEKMKIAAAFTAGDSTQLMVGRNGVFYDRKGRDWNATIIKIIDHPISIRQAFWSPYRKIGGMVGDQLQKMGGARAEAVEKQAQTAVAEGGKKVEAGKAGAAAPQAAPFDVAKFAGIFAAIGLALGAIGTAIAAVVTGFLGLVWWQMPLAIAGLLLAISGPSMFLAWLKLRSRTLGPVLDANGWAVNARARINIPFGTELTRLAELPAGAERSMSDPYAEKRTARRIWLLLLLVALAVFVWRMFMLPH